MKRRVNLEHCLLIGAAALSLGMLVFGCRYPRIPAMFPKGISLITLILTVYYLVGQLRATASKEGGGEERVTATEDDGQAQVQDQGGPRNQTRVAMPWWIMAGIAFAYVGLVSLLGFFVATVAFVAIIPKLLGARQSLLFATSLGIVIALVFVAMMKWVFEMPIPMGLFWPR